MESEEVVGLKKRSNSVAILTYFLYPLTHSFQFRLCLFWVKIISGNAFPEMRLFGSSGKFYFPEIEIR